MIEEVYQTYNGSFLSKQQVSDLQNKGRDLQSQDCRISSFRIGDIESKFLIVNELDVIQKHQGRGQFYEGSELLIMAEYFKPGMKMVDVGTNVGNHTIFALQHLKAQSVICFEPNPTAYNILRVNLALNNLTDRATHYAIGLSDKNFMASMSHSPNNLGGARINTKAQNLGIPIMIGDEILKDTPYDFIKIDVEGVEMQTLKGLENSLATNRPIMFIEVDTVNIEIFNHWVDIHNYEVVKKYKRYEANENFLLRPKL